MKNTKGVRTMKKKLTAKPPPASLMDGMAAYGIGKERCQSIQNKINDLSL